MKARFLSVTAAVCFGVIVAGAWQASVSAGEGSAAAAIAAMGAAINAKLEARGANFRAEYAEFLTPDNSGEVGTLVFFRDRGNKQQIADFVPGDPRRGSRTDITYIVDQTDVAIDGLSTAQTTAAIDRAMSTWDDVECSNIPITRLPNVSGDLGVAEFVIGLGGSLTVHADITHAGWLPGDILPPEVVAFTVTFGFADANSVPTDINNDHRLDVAFREIYNNDQFTWRINGNVDVQSVALHEAGHGLSQAHFGGLFSTKNGRFQFNPRAVMNAAYTGVLQTLTGSDNAGHCSDWASWPQR